MANRFPLIVDASALQIKELPANDNIDLASSGIVNAVSIGVTNINATGVVTATGGFNLGISSAGTAITSGPVKTLNFVGTGNTFAVNGTTVDISIVSGGGGGGGGGSGLFNTGITSSVGYAVTTGMNTAYSASNTVIVHSIHITNIDGTNSADVSGQMYAGAFSIAHLVPVPAGSSVELLKQPKILSTGETIQLQASADSDLHATVTVENQTGNSSYIGVGTDITSAATYTNLWVATANAMLQSILLANDDGTNDVKVRVVWTDASNNIQGYYAYDLTVPADATVEILEKPKYLPNGYKVRIYANQANRLEAILAARTI